MLPKIRLLISNRINLVNHHPSHRQDHNLTAQYHQKQNLHQSQIIITREELKPNNAQSARNRKLFIIVVTAAVLPTWQIGKTELVVPVARFRESIDIR